jgi:hypothetical protein
MHAFHRGAREKDEETSALLAHIDEIDETTVLAFDQYRSARDQLPVFKNSGNA